MVSCQWSVAGKPRRMGKDRKGGGTTQVAAQAEQVEREALPLLRHRLGPGHPDTLVCEANLAVTLHMAGREDQARELRDRILAEMDRVLGENHPNGTLLREWDRNNRDLEPQPI